MVNVTDSLCTKQGNVGKKSAVYNQERVTKVLVWYFLGYSLYEVFQYIYHNRYFFLDFYFISVLPKAADVAFEP